MKDKDVVGPPKQMRSNREVRLTEMLLVGATGPSPNKRGDHDRTATEHESFDAATESIQ